MCVAPGVDYDAFDSGFEYRCPDCDPDAVGAASRRQRVNGRLESIMRVYQLCSPHMWQAYCNLDTAHTTPLAVAAATNVDSFGFPTQEEPLSFTNGWDRGLTRILSLCNDAEVAHLSRGMTQVVETRFGVR